MAAGVFFAPRGLAFEPTCTECHEPELRTKWGCDTPAAEPIAWIDPCHVCAGDHPECPECAGTGRAPVHRCPQQLATARERDVLLAAVMVEHGLLPDPGGWQDQPHTFVQAYPTAAQEIARWREKAAELAARAAKQKRR